MPKRFVVRPYSVGRVEPIYWNVFDTKTRKWATSSSSHSKWSMRKIARDRNRAVRKGWIDD
jgi:hypothetical protein